jgi:pyruvate/2-oxoglutarate dehydrogenase complex dihydrolipoamide dehydrogenase (E3) component
MNIYDVAIIGSGAAGLTVAVGMARLGKKVLLVEKHKVGGDCTNVGCVPSKTLIHLSQDLGSSTASEILAQVRAHRDALEQKERRWLEQMKGVTLVFGQAAFVDSQILAIRLVDQPEHLVRAKRIVIASGARARMPKLPGLPPERYLTNENLFDLEDLPRHLAIVGAGIVGTEMAFAFRRLGCRVSLVGAVLPRHEPEVGAAIERSLDTCGVARYPSARGVGYQSQSESLIVEGGEVPEIGGVDKVLVAVGRRPNLDLGLEAVGVPFDAQGIHTNAVGHTGCARIYAIGDVVARSTTTHSANHQGRRLVKHLVAPFFPLGKEPHYPSAVFCRPEVAQVGPTLATLRQDISSELIMTVRHDLKDTDRGYTSFLQEGFVLMHALRLTGKLLSATVVAPGAGEMIPLLTHAVNGGPSLYRISDQVFPYPTLSEAIRKAADSFVFETLANPRREVATYARHRLKAVLR